MPLGGKRSLVIKRYLRVGFRLIFILRSFRDGPKIPLVEKIILISEFPETISLASPVKKSCSDHAFFTEIII